jgi:hypothetical protein
VGGDGRVGPLVSAWCRDGTLAEPLELAARLATALGLEPTGSSLVCVPIADPEPVRAALEAAGIRAAVRGDAIRFSLHVWNDAAMWTGQSRRSARSWPRSYGGPRWGAGWLPNEYVT